MPRKGLRETLCQLWLLPGEISWMDPLPLAHRRGIIAGVVLILLAFLWPSPAPRQQPASPAVSTRQQHNDATLQANIVDNNTRQPSAADNNPPPQTSAKNDVEGDWRDYQIARGQTLAQLFRDNNLQVSDVFAMARVEGDGKPLSNLQQGQTVKVRITPQGVVTGLTVEGSNGPALFTRQSDGSFIRVR
ncbi:Opacity-associated protein A [Erwinia sp. OLTSP20]|uniref:LysM-like peptidoglycan-binding domain-containing protein n=1 Tax=unclassified Erwinia TaxID=2622719 RepID=UPI000C47FDF2|nr:MULTISPECIES: LysM-like peptidoglycan-binding domain-containing protein [unclassified Erwinia]PIJ52056.1 Opacity-associated protein A [Erwinia sp. OAMSP11]PIJ75219.1 Opacity-associated protein A [Erwinia sp. OLSSP12]PIJ84426.1 Opacity-associated protein A [Erwinia sp. OLCASP19]PIJ87040.1 Opacity-associated protein A [Erwinia sp. OLMTSP26]PIJ88604.1 Opacity-associated protein A [Erwinia sp. OLMDSP33]